MSITPLSAARIAGELGLAGGTITGGCCAAHYAKKLNANERKIDEYEEGKRQVDQDYRQFSQTLSKLRSDSMTAESYCRYHNWPDNYLN